jgi:hypothetical protein
MFKLIDFDQVQSRRIHQFTTYWRSKIGDQAIPRRGDIDPAELKSLLPWMMIVEIEANPFRLRYRLAGTKIVDMNQCELTGRYLDELAEEGSAELTQQGIAAYHLAWTRRQPVYATYRWPTQSGSKYSIEFAIFPIDDLKTAGQCMALEDWDIDAAVAARREPPVPYVKARRERPATMGAVRR